jgi:exonuclease SbcC
MRIGRLRLLNFRQHRDTTVEFGPGITGIIGPNGAGKTTLLEAIAWAIYGMRAARGTRDSIRWRRATPRAEVRVELEFGLGPHEYRVVRTLFGAELFLDGGPRPIASSPNDVTDRLARLVRMSRDEFFKTFFTGQKDLAVMAELGATERRRFLNRLLDYDRLTAAQRKARERRGGLQETLDGLLAGAPDPAALAAARAALAEEHAAADARLAAALEAQSAAKAASDQHLPVFSGMKEFQARYRALRETRAVAAERVTHAVETIGRLARERDEAAAAAAQRAAQLEDLGRRLARAREAAARVRGIAERLDQARAEEERAQSAYEERRGAWERDRADAEAVRRSLRDQFKDIKAQKDRILAAGPEGACPTCGRPLRGEYAGVVDLIDGQLAEVTQSGQFYAARVEQLGPVPEDLMALDQRRHALHDAVERHVEELALAHRAADEAVALEREQQRLSAEAERVPRLEAELAAASAKRAELVEALAAVERDLAALAFNEEAFLGAEAEMARLEAAWRAAELAVGTARLDLQLALERLREAERREAEAAARLERTRAIQHDVRLHGELDRAFSDLSAELNAEIGPELSAIASELLSALTDGQFDELQLDEELNATVLVDGEPREVLSGGEEDIRNLVLRLAVSQMIAERSGQPLSLLVLDEIFGSLDEARSENVVRLLRGLEGRFPQVVLITHVESVRESLDRVLRVRYDEAAGASVVTEERGTLPPTGGAGADVAA